METKPYNNKNNGLFTYYDVTLLGKGGSLHGYERVGFQYGGIFSWRGDEGISKNFLKIV